jgi:GNAT superfamily N-acetyltransferase
MVDPQLVRELEEASLHSLPALSEERYDGWVLRTAEGYSSRRSNSIWPIYSSSIDLDEKVARCEAVYSDASLPCTFKLTEGSFPDGLDAYLAARGYARDAETCVQTFALSERPPLPPDVELLDRPDGAWISVWASFAARGNGASTLLKLLRATQGSSTFALIHDGGRPVGCARATISGSWVGLFDLVVAPAARGRGLGRNLALARLAWAHGKGVRRAFAQVMVDNPAARALQTALGFEERYRYWYRIESA